MHHIITDATSDIVIKKDLTNALRGNLDKSVDLGFVYLGRDSFESKYKLEYQSAKKFYSDEFADIDEIGFLLDDVDGSKGSVSLPIHGVHDRIEEFTRNIGISVGSFLNAVFAYTFSRFTGSNMVYYNFTEHGRHEEYSQNALGMFVRTIPILVDCKNKSIYEYLSCVSDLILESMENNIYPFRLIASEFNLTNDVIFEYNYDLNDVSDIGDEIIFSNDVNSVSEFSCVVQDLDDGYIVNVSHLDKFSQDTAARFVYVFKEVLIQFLDKENLGDVNYISDDDISLLDKFNQTETSFKYDDILDAFNDNLAKYENEVLVGYDDNCYTYGESAFIIHEIARELSDLGVNSQDFVALFVNRSEWFLLASMGVLSGGAIYVPVESTYPDERIILMLEDTQSKVVIVSDDTEQRILRIIVDNNLNINVLNVSAILDEEIGSLNYLDYVEVGENDVACVLYTSGTTGTPKGSLTTRKAINNFVSWYVDATGFSCDDVYGMHCSYVFDIHTAALYAPVITGGALYIVPEDIRLNLKALNNYYVEHNCTHTYITSQVGKLFAECGMETTIKLLCFGGMKLGELNAPDSIGPFETYGPSENLAVSTSIFANKRIHSSSIGYFVSNVKGYVLDEEHRRVPFGAVGELYLAGIQLTPGYLNRTEENNSAFIENPFDDVKGYEYIYKTGDLVKYLPDGTLGIIGRQDSQVKIRGNRVELTEVESVIRNIKEIEDVTVQIINNNGNNELVAYVVASEYVGDENLRDYVCDYVGGHKPEYMVPSYVIKLDEIPLNVNGKIDKEALPEIDMDMLRVEYVSPVTEIEKYIVKAFEVVFNQKDIGLNDDFVRLGGDSITAIRVISLLEKNNISCNARDILNFKTPYLIAQNIEILESVSYDDVEGVVDLLPIQEYFFDQINTNNYMQFFALKSNEILNKNILQNSFDELANVHDMLRANYSYGENGDVIQEILPLNTRICEINEYSINENFDESLKKIFINSLNSLDVRNKLIDINLIQYNDENYLIIVIHHLIVDGVSWNIFINDLTYIYNNLKADNEIKLIKPYSYKDWVSEVKQLAINLDDDERKHWINLNTLLDDSIIKGKSQLFNFKVDINYNSDNLLMLSEEEYLALAIARAYKKTYNLDIIFNRESHGRDETIADINKTIGWFTSQFPVLVKTKVGYDNVSLLNDVYELKNSFKKVNNLGLNYASLIYTLDELRYKHCPVTFNFLSSEFVFKNELFESINHLYFDNNEGNIDNYPESYGITLNIDRVDNYYIFSGDYAKNTYLGDEFSVFADNIKNELEFIGNFDFRQGNICCCLSESQLGVYLDEKVHDKGVAYAVPGIFECESDISIDKIKNAISCLIDKHPILKSRIVDGNIPLLLCDSYPSIQVINDEDYSEFIKPFDLNKCLSRFFIVDNSKGKFIFYDMHHCISDATSRTIINNELADALMDNLDDAVDLGFVYASRDSFESKFDSKYKSAEKFFKDEFIDIDEVGFLLNEVDGRKGSVSLAIHDVRTSVEAFTRNIGITVGSFLNAIFAYSYSRFTGSDKVYYNFTENGRHEDYLKNALGMYVRTIPIIVDCSNKSIEDYVSNVSDLIFNSMSNSIYPFRLISRDFNLNYDVSFEYNYDLNEILDVNDGLQFSDDSTGVSEFSCSVHDMEDGFVVVVDHFDKFTQNTAARFANVFKEVLIQFLEKYELSDINYISNDDLYLLDTYNQTECDLTSADVLNLFNENLIKCPNNKLVSYNSIDYSYGECAFIADKISIQLKNKGILKQDNVAFLVERSELYMFSILAIMSVGAIYIPLDEALPDEHLRYILDDTKTEIIIVSNNTYERAKNLINDNVLLLNISDIVKDEIGTLSELPVVCGDLACILYTSGTTGVPKGVKITRKALINFSEFYIKKYGLNENDIFALYASIGFDVSMEAIFSVICSGASLSIIPEDIKLDIKALNDYFIEKGVTYTHLPAQVAKIFIEQIGNTSLKVLCTGGEKLGEIDTNNIGYRLVDSYGPTETFVDVTSIDVDEKILHL